MVFPILLIPHTGKDELLLDTADFETMYDSQGVVVTSFKISPCQRYLGAVVEGSPDVYDAHIIKMEDGGLTNVVECIPDVVSIGKIQFVDHW